MYCVNCAPETAEVETEAAGLPVASEGGPIDVSLAFSFVLADPDWLKKLAIGSLMMLGSFLVFPFLVALGYTVEIIRSVASGCDTGLPEWDNFGEKLKSGAEFFVLGILYSLPLVLAVAITVIIGLVTGGGTADITSLPGVGEWFALVGFLLGLFMSFSLFLLVSLVTPAFAGRYAVTGGVESGLRPGVIIGMVRADLRSYLVVLAVSVLALGFLNMLGLLFCCVGVFITAFYTLVVNGHLCGQLARLCPLED